MRVEATHPGIALEQIQEQTGFPLEIAPHVVVTAEPGDDELDTLRALDPERRFLG
jgi:glutaconate CoA-transferase subunit B